MARRLPVVSVSALPVRRRARRPWTIVAGALALAVVGLGHAIVLRIPADVATPLVIASHLYALIVLVGLLWLAAALGRSIMTRAGLTTESRLEQDLFAIGIGLGAISTTVVCLGLARLLSPPVLGIAVATMAVAVRRELASIWLDLPESFRATLALRRSIRREGRVLALLVPMVELLFAALLLRTLAPPFENDVLIYHLRGPQLFLAHGGLEPLPDIQQANMPLAINMLYLLGLAFGSDELNGVLHLALASFVAVATFSFGRRFFGTRVGWIAATTCLSTQLLLVVATVGFIDYGLTFFDFLAVYAFAVWRESGSRGWLVMSGLLVGCALASKHLGITTAVSLGIWLLVVAGMERKRRGLLATLGILLSFGLSAALVVGPWYAKNLVWFGNPVWPVLAPNPTGFNQYLGNASRFGGTDGVLGPAIVAVFLYVYGSLELPMVRPPLQLLMIPLYLLVPRHRIVTALLCLAGVQFLVWSQGAHVLRYALPGLPAASIVAAYVLAQLIEPARWGRLAAALATALVAVGLVLPTAQTVAIVFAERPLPQLVGLESRQAFLEQKLASYPLLIYLNEGQEPVSRVLMIGDYRTYYLHQPAWVDGTMETLQRLAQAPDAQAARAILAQRDISHVLVNSRDLLYFVPIDPDGSIITWWQRFEANRAGYLEPIATNESSVLYRVRP
jgi:hypothetical protein